MNEWIISTLDKFGYLGVFLLIAIENIFPPIPSEIILTFAGFSTISTSMTLLGVIMFSTLGSMVGAVILYMLGRFLSVQRLERLFAGRLGRVLRLKASDVRRAHNWFIKRGGRAVLICRFVPIVRSLISIPAGMSKMNFIVFMLLSLLGTAVWNTILVILGRIAGSAWETVSQYFDTYSTIALIIFLATAAILLMIFIKRRFFGEVKDNGVIAGQNNADTTQKNGNGDRFKGDKED